MRLSTVSPVLSIAIAALTTGCLKGPFNAPADATVSFSLETITVNDVPTYRYLDGVGAAFPLSVFVAAPDRYEDEYGLANTWVEVFGPSQGVYILPQDAVQAVSYPEANANPDQVEEICYDEDGNRINNSGENEWCGWHYDETSGRYIQVGNEYADAAGFTEDGEPYGPNYVKSATDRNGFFQFWVFVDALPSSGVGYPSSDTDDGSSDGGDGSSDTGTTTAAAPPPADTGDTGGGGGDDGGDGGDDSSQAELQEVALWASIGVDSTSIIIGVDE